jgi:hypothetical protein
MIFLSAIIESNNDAKLSSTGFAIAYGHGLSIFCRQVVTCEPTGRALSPQPIEKQLKATERFGDMNIRVSGHRGVWESEEMARLCTLSLDSKAVNKAFSGPKRILTPWRIKAAAKLRRVEIARSSLEHAVW